MTPFSGRRGRGARIALIITGALATGISACARLPEPPRGLVIVTLDTTRADRLPAYGASGIPTPALDRLAREGVVFRAH